MALHLPLSPFFEFSISSIRIVGNSFLVKALPLVVISIVLNVYILSLLGQAFRYRSLYRALSSFGAIFFTFRNGKLVDGLFFSWDVNNRRNLSFSCAVLPSVPVQCEVNRPGEHSTLPKAFSP